LAFKWSDHLSLYGQPYGLPIPQVSFAGEPKDVFSAALSHPFIRIISIQGVSTTD